MQTNAPASSEFVDQFNRAVTFQQIQVDGGGGVALTNPLVLPLGGSVDTRNGTGTGGSIDTSGSSTGGGTDGGSINTSGGGDGDGGSINTSDGGGSIDTTGQGSIGLGTANNGTQTLIVGQAVEANKTVYFPDASGTVAVCLTQAFTVTFGTIAGNSFVASQRLFTDSVSGDPVLVTCTTSRLLAGLSQNIIFDGYISVNGSLVIVAHNPTTLPIVLTALDFKVVVFKL